MDGRKILNYNGMVHSIWPRKNLTQIGDLTFLLFIHDIYCRYEKVLEVRSVPELKIYKIT